ncbi:MAG: DUF2269 family protein [Actinomycetota bacterium]
MRVWLVLHVLAAIGGVGPEIAFGIMGPRARRQSGATAAVVYEAIAHARVRVVYPLIALQIASGIALILLGRRSILGEAWLATALILYGIAILLVAAVLTPGSARARRVLAAGTEPSDPGLRALWTRQAAAGSVAGSFLIAVAVLMVWKPGL